MEQNIWTIGKIVYKKYFLLYISKEALDDIQGHDADKYGLSDLYIFSVRQNSKSTTTNWYNISNIDEYTTLS